MVGPWQLDETFGHADLPQAIRQQLRLSRWHYLVLAPVGEERRGVAGFYARNRRRETVVLGDGVLGTLQEGFHPAQVAEGGEASEVGGR